jgi:hypothetical protein
MTTNPPIIRDSLLVLPGVVGLSAWFGGTDFALEVAFTGLVAVGNFGLWAWLITAFLRSLTTENGNSGLTGMFLGLKMTMTVPVFVAMMLLTSPIAVSAGMFTVVVGLTLRGLIYAMRSTHDAGEAGHGTPHAGET